VINLIQKAKHHLKENGMSYFEHLSFAIFYGFVCIKAGIFLCIHGLFPCFFQRAGSRLVHKLEKIFTERENKINELNPDTPA
jgi:hypothetical protein